MSSDKGSGKESNKGSDKGFDMESNKGSDKESNKGSDRGFDNGSDNGSGNGSGKHHELQTWTWLDKNKMSLVTGILYCGIALLALLLLLKVVRIMIVEEVGTTLDGEKGKQVLIASTMCSEGVMVRSLLKFESGSLPFFHPLSNISISCVF